MLTTLRLNPIVRIRQNAILKMSLASRCIKFTIRGKIAADGEEIALVVHQTLSAGAVRACFSKRFMFLRRDSATAAVIETPMATPHTLILSPSRPSN